MAAEEDHECAVPPPEKLPSSLHHFWVLAQQLPGNIQSQ